MLANNGSNEEKFFHTSWLPVKENGHAKEDMGGSGEDGYEEMQPLWGFGPR